MRTQRKALTLLPAVASFTIFDRLDLDREQVIGN
jgi:hypothetical protein